MSRSARHAHQTLNDWEAEEGAVEDDRIRSAEAMTQRIEDYSGPSAAPTAAAHAMVQLLYDSLADLMAVDTLRAAGSARRDKKHQVRAESLAERINDRMDQALSMVADIYEAVLSHDDIALREVVARADAEALRMHAEVEVSTLLRPPTTGAE